jgi:hypothetical protein
MGVFLESAKSYVAKIGDLPAIVFEADDDTAFVHLLHDAINAVQSLQDLDGRIMIGFIRPDKTMGQITADDARRHSELRPVTNAPAEEQRLDGGRW